MPSLKSIAAAAVAGTAMSQTSVCDVAYNANTPCVAAHSMVRALYGGYKGPLYQVIRGVDGKVMDITPVAPGGVANAAAQDTFCAGSSCFILQVRVARRAPQWQGKRHGLAHGGRVRPRSAVWRARQAPAPRGVELGGFRRPKRAVKASPLHAARETVRRTVALCRRCGLSPATRAGLARAGA